MGHHYSSLIFHYFLFQFFLWNYFQNGWFFPMKISTWILKAFSKQISMISILSIFSNTSGESFSKNIFIDFRTKYKMENRRGNSKSGKLLWMFPIIMFFVTFCSSHNLLKTYLEFFYQIFYNRETIFLVRFPPVFMNIT